MMKKYNIITILLFMVTMLSFLSSCMVVRILAMAKEQKTTIKTWEDDNYKVRIQRRRGWAGPHYFHCKVIEKKMCGLYYKRIINETFSRERYSACIINFPLRSDTLVVVFCNENVKSNKQMKKDATKNIIKN